MEQFIEVRGTEKKEEREGNWEVNYGKQKVAGPLSACEMSWNRSGQLWADTPLRGGVGPENSGRRVPST